MAFIRTWNRLEPLARHKDLRDGLEARLADPLWLLGRQWQFGEFKGSDGGSPVLARIEADRADLARYQAGDAGANAAAEPFDPLRQPLEVRVEAETRSDAGGLSFWLAESTRLQKLLKARNVSGATLRALRLAYPIDENTVLAQAGPLETQQMNTRALLALAGGKAIDAERYSADASASFAAGAGLPAALAALPPTEAARVEPATRAWLREFRGPASAQQSAWQAERIEYSFSTAADLNGEVVLEAAEYGGGRLDWHAFDARRDRALGAPPDGNRRIVRTSLPVPVDYAGMPADRYWAFEDHPVRFGQIATGKTDIARLLLAEFALVYGNDWFLVPVELPLGSIVGNTTVTVTDSFGATVEIKPDRDSETRLFQLSTRDADAQGLFLLAPSLTTSDIGEPMESVTIIRDELANVVWGIEARVPDNRGGVRDRSEDPPGVAGRLSIQDLPPDAELIYRLNSTVPANWIPYVPVQTGAGAAPRTMLEQRVIESLRPDGTLSKAPPEGILLTEATRIEHEEVTREGIILERQLQLTRWTDGRYHLWTGRRKRVGKGEGSSGLRFDFTEEV